MEPNKDDIKEKFRILVQEIKAGVMEHAKDEAEKRVAEVLNVPVSKLKGHSITPAQHKEIEGLLNAPLVRKQKDYQTYVSDSEMSRHYNFWRDHDGQLDRSAKYIAMLARAIRGRDHEAMAYVAQVHSERKAAMQEDTDSEGGYLVPTELEAELLFIQKLAGIELYCRPINMESKTRKVPSLSTWPTVAWTAEEGTITESEPVLAEVDLTAKRVDAYSIISNELIEDSAVDVQNMLIELFTQAVAQELDNQILNGTGDPVSGVLTAAAGNSVVLGSGEVSFSSVDADDISDSVSQLDAGASAGARLFFHQTVIHHLRILKDSNSSYVFPPGSASPGSMWGVPLLPNDKAPDTSTATQANKAFGVCGNFAYFLVGRRKGISFEMDPYGLFTTYQTRLRVIRRVALAIGQANAFCRFVSAAS